MTQPARRISGRTKFERPVEARLGLCRGEVAEGWVVDEQEEGVGMRFGGDDADRMAAHRECCGSRVLEFSLSSGRGERGPFPAKIVHEGVQMRFTKGQMPRASNARPRTTPAMP